MLWRDPASGHKAVNLMQVGLWDLQGSVEEVEGVEEEERLVAVVLSDDPQSILVEHGLFEATVGKTVVGIIHVAPCRIDLRLDPRFLDMLHVGVASQLASHSFCDTRPVSSVVEGEVSELVQANVNVAGGC